MSETAGPKKTLKRARRANTDRVYLAATRTDRTEAFWRDVHEDGPVAPPALRKLVAGEDLVVTYRGEAMSALRWAREQEHWDREHAAVTMIGARQHAHQVKVTAQEEAALKLRAQEHGVTIPRLMLESALAPAGHGASERREALVELFRVRRQLAGVATNVNQIAHAVNSDGRLPIGSAATLARIEEVVGKLDAAIEDLAVS
jgi:hypothetical protein